MCLLVLIQSLDFSHDVFYYQYFCCYCRFVTFLMLDSPLVLHSKCLTLHFEQKPKQSLHYYSIVVLSLSLLYKELARRSSHWRFILNNVTFVGFSKIKRVTIGIFVKSNRWISRAVWRHWFIKVLTAVPVLWIN